MKTKEEIEAQPAQFKIHHFLDGYSTCDSRSLKGNERKILNEKIELVITIVSLVYELPHNTKHVKELVDSESNPFAQFMGTREMFRVHTTHFRKVWTGNFIDIFVS